MTKLIGMAGFADQFGVSVETARYWVWKGTAPRSVKIGKRRYFDPADIEAWIDSKRATEAADVV